MTFLKWEQAPDVCQVAEEGAVAPSIVCIVSSMSSLVTTQYDRLYKG